jgi:molybdenum cofactor cytidylyltransferase
MGRPKLSLPLGGRTVLEHVLGALRRAGVDHSLVIVGPHAAGLGPLAAAGGAHVLHLPGETADMRATVEHGLRWLGERFGPAPDDAWLLVPADHPALAPGGVGALEEARRSHPAHSIFVPTHAGRRGHPTLLAWRHAAAVAGLPPGAGLNAFVRAHSADVLEVPVDDPDVLCDLDTPADYERLARDPRWGPW